MRPNITVGVSTAIAFRVAATTKITRNGVVVTLPKILGGDLANIKYFQFREFKAAALVEARSASPVTIKAY